jgi:hypothetical protein
VSELLRVGNAQGFWGDQIDAPAALLRQQPDLDYITLDYLAEVSLSIMAGQRERDVSAGYARDFVDVVRSLSPFWRAGSRAKLITNAGGLNPYGCAQACAAVLRAAGGKGLRLGVVSGDDVLPLLRAAKGGLEADSYRNLETGEPIWSVMHRLVTANAYLGARPIVDALAAGADVVITGRVADPSLTVGACVQRFGWSWQDHDRLAGATVAGHLIECGTQVSGGISTDWLDVPDPAHIGFPVVEMDGEGGCVVTKPPGTGGRVDERTVKEQLLYEIGDPDNYLSPDATVSFLGLRVEGAGPDRVRVRGAKGCPPPPAYKVSATYRAGFRASGTLTIFGRDAAAKARRCGEIVLQRVRDAGYEPAGSLVECLGPGAAAGGVLDGKPEAELLETVLRISVSDPRRETVERFAKELAPLVTSGPQGTTGYAGGRPKVQPVFGYWPCLVDRRQVTPRVEMMEV